MATKVLELCAGEPSAKGLWPDCEVTLWDFTSPIPEEMYNQFDIVFSSNVLQRTSYHLAAPMINAYKECLKDGGSLHIIVPSLEWAAREILSENPNPACQIMIWGGQGGDGSVHMAGFTMRHLRALLERVGLSTTLAKTFANELKVGQNTYKVEQHHVGATKGFAELQKE